ncbi:hypothetical protein CA3LBN_003929 [Candidozyma haemuli]|uniref:Sfi1 spindle body domain-containing protein n=1 Tax=Candidozyma haemuli TaxID=45357 RepID=A0ABX8I8H2_9ASCO|nr:hypothetical protein CA3LBN_003929 [[Candida] haemuloni]
MVEHNQIYHLVRDLHSLQDLRNGEAQFHSIFKKVVEDVLRLVGLKHKHRIKITIHTSQFPALTLTCYCKPQRANEKPNIQQLAQHESHSHGPSYFDHLLQALSTTSIDNGRPRYVKESYKAIVEELFQYIQSASEIYSYSKDHLAEFLGQCLIHEYTIAKNLDQKVELATDETQQLASVLDELLNKSMASDSDSIFEYNVPSASKTGLLNFTCDDEALNKAYEAVLHLTLLKPESSVYSSVPSLVRILLSMFEKHHAIECMEIESFENREKQLQLFYEFFLGSEQLPGVVPSQYVQQAESILDSVEFPTDIPSLVKGNESDHELAAIAETSVSEGFSQHELGELLSNLSTVVNLLNEYDPQFHPQFPQIFKQYVLLVYEDYTDLACLADYRYIEELTNLVGQISEYEANEDMNGDSVRSIVDHLHYSQGFLTSGYQSSTILMRLANKIWSSSYEITKQIFRKWNDRTISAIHLSSKLFQNSLERDSKILNSRFSIWYDKFMRLSMLVSQAENYSGKKLLARVLKDLWIPKLIHVGDLEYQSQRFVIKNRFLAWRARTERRSQINRKSREFYNRNLAGACFNQLKEKHKHYEDNVQKAVAIHRKVNKKCDNIILQNVIRKWHRSLDSSNRSATRSMGSTKDFVLSEKLIALDKIETRYTSSKHFNLWHKKMRLLQTYSKCSHVNSNNTKAFFFRGWRRSFMLKGLQNEWEAKQDRNFARSALEIWSQHKNHRVQASGYQRKISLGRVMKKWKLAHKKKSSRLELSLGTIYLKAWRLRMISRNLTDSASKRILERSFSKWKTMNVIHSEDEARASHIAKLSLQKATLALWKSRMDMHEELRLVAQLNFERQYFLRWKEKTSDANKYLQLAANFRENGLSFKDRYSAKFHIRLWQNRIVSRFEAYANEAIDNFHEKVRHKRTLSIFIKHWQNESAKIGARRKKLNLLLQQHNTASSALAPVLNHWKDKTLRYREHYAMSLEFHDAVLHKKVMVLWYEKLLIKSNYLEELADDLLSQKSYATSLEYLQKWNLKYIKTYKRNLQTCTMFQEKWNASKARSLLQVWRFKALHREFTDDKQEDEYMEADTSVFFSSLSPLAKKRGSFLEGHSYLHTPVKKQVSSIPFTPSSKIRRTSPTRLDTNMKMNSDKIDALINHYRKAKSKRGLPSRPPAPQFERILEASPKATSSPFEPKGYQKLPSPLPSADIDESVLSTAKKLKRFRPLVIPNSESTGGASGSPAVKLRERLENASRSFNTHSVS